MRFVQINLQHAKASTALLCTKLAKQHTSIALIQEPWIAKSKVSGFQSLKSHRVYWDKTQQKPRAIIVIDKNIPAHPLPLFTNRDATTIQIDSQDGQTIVICSAYMPSDQPNPPSEQIRSLVTHCKSNHHQLIIGCDANAHSTVWGSRDINKRGESILDFLLLYNLEIANKGNTPTFMSSRYNSVIDLTITTPSLHNKIKDWRVSDEETLSDHKMLEFCLAESHTFTNSFFNPKKMDLKTYHDAVLSQTTSSEFSFPFDPFYQQETLPHCIEETTSKITDILTNAFQSSCPKTTTKRSTSKPWWNPDLEKLRKLTKNSLQKAKRYSNGPLCHTPIADQRWEEYRSYRRDYKRLVNQAKSESWQRFCTDAESVKSTARVQKLLCKVNDHQVDWVMDSNGHPTMSPKDTINTLLDTHFPGNRVYAPDNPRNPVSSEPALKTNNLVVNVNDILTPQKVTWALESFQPYKAPGPDGIFPICIKSLPRQMIHLITALFRLCLIAGYVPQGWRHTKVIFIPKPGKQNYYDPKSFRPISLTCFLLKTLERCIELYLKSQVLTKSPIKHSQHAYCPGRSTDSALHQLVSKLEKSLLKKNSTLCTFLDIQGAFDHTTPQSISLALQNHNTPKFIISFIMAMLQSRYISVTLHGVTTTRSIGKGCPQGGILSPLLWNLVMNGLLAMLETHKIWSLGYADDLVICVENQDPVITAEVTQHALNLIENWCTDQMLSVNPKKAEAMLVTKKSKYHLPNIKIFKDQIQYKNTVKYLGVYIDRRLTWSFHITQKIQKAFGTLWMCKSAINQTWGLGVKQIIWILQSIVTPGFLHGALVWWEAAQKTTCAGKLARINRSALLLATGAFRTTPGLALEYLFQIHPLEIKAQQVAMNTLYRLIRTGIQLKPLENSHTKLVNQMSELVFYPSDYTQKRIMFCNQSINFVFHSKDDWLQELVDLDIYDICAYTDGSSHELGVGTGVFIQLSESKSNGLFDSEETSCISIPLTKSTTIFQAEMIGISTAAVVLASAENKNIAILTDSIAAIQSLQNPEVKSKTKLECINSLNDLAAKNQVTLVWVPGHTGIHGNERADELANIAGALDTMGPEPSPPISESTIKQGTKSWASETFEEKWHASKKCANTKAVIKHLKNKIKAPLLQLRKPLLSHTINTITGHGPFREHLARMKLADETSCPNCGAVTDSHIHFIFECHKHRKIRKQILKIESQPNKNENQLCITVPDLAGYIKLSDRFSANRC